jgi:hypothetical protein
MLGVIATRSGRLALARVRASSLDPEAIQNDVLNIVEIDTDDRIAAVVVFDLEDFDAAIAELDARYLASEAASHAHTWSIITRAYATLNRRELPATTPDWVNIDHRGARSFASGDMSAYIRAGFDLEDDVCIYTEAVHRLTNLGAVVTTAAHGTSQEGFDAEWREIAILTVEGELINRCEMFEEADIDAALARLDELSRPMPRLENAASRAGERLMGHFAASEWDGMAEMLADNLFTDDRRRVVGAGIQHGRDAQIADFRAFVWVTNVTPTIVATRGEHLALQRARFSDRDHGPEAFFTEALSLGEINADERFVAFVTFDPDDIDAAFAELDARYLAGEAAEHAQIWSVITRSYAAFNRHELAAADWVTIDHRPLVAIGPSDLPATIRAVWDLTPDVSIRVEAVHRLSSFGAVVTDTVHGTSSEGFDAEWRMIQLLTVEGDRINRCEVFDEADLDVALAKFEELHPQTPRLENAASRAGERLLGHFAASEWDGMAELLADSLFTDDRRRVVGAGIRHGLEAQIADFQAMAGVWITNVTPTIVATRGERLALQRARFSDRDRGPEAFLTETLGLGEINADERFVAFVTFDPDDLDAAFEELDARYLAGEAAAHAGVWSVIARTYAAVNRHEILPTAPNWINVDHRRLARASIQTDDLTTYLRAVWDLTPDLTIYVEAVHRLSERGAVVTHAARGRSPQGFEAEWRLVEVLTVEGELINRCEVFDEADLDSALARFEELHPQMPRLENAATRVSERMDAYFVARDWDAITEILADGHYNDDRRRVVNAGIRHGRDVEIANMRAGADLGATNITPTVIATRGERLALRRARYSGRDPRPEAFRVEVLIIVEMDADERILAFVLFDVDDIDAAFEELDARYLVGEAAAHVQTWSVITDGFAAFKRHELPAAEWVTVDHRPLVTIDASDLTANIRATWDLMPDISIHIEAVHRLSGFGAVFTVTANGTSPQGFDAEWRMIQLLTVEGDRTNRRELFDEADLDAALARFEELHPQTPRLENAASHLVERFQAYFGARNWAAISEISADEIFTDDRRSVVSSGILRGRDIDIANIRATADLGATALTGPVIATRGERLALTRLRLSGRDQRPEAFHSEMLGIVEIDAHNRFAARFLFDLNDIDAAFEELDARYLAGEAAEHAHTWSVIAALYAGFNRGERPPTTRDWSFIDHRKLISVEAGDLPTFINATLGELPSIRIYMETVHRLSDLGAVVTHTARGISHEDFDAEWRMIDIFTIEGDLISRCEMFDEADIDAALARFDELRPQARRLENAASRLDERLLAHWGDRQFDAIAEVLADDSFVDDRRRGVNAGLWQGCDDVIANLKALAGEANTTSTVIAIRGERLALARLCFANLGLQHGDFRLEMLSIVEIDANNQIAAHIVLDFDDINAAFAELDARYLSGEAAEHAHTWSVNAGFYAGFNRHELPATTPDWIYIDHRPLVTIEANDLTASMRAIWDLAPDISIYIETVHRLSDLGAVVTAAVYGSSQGGFNAEWRMIDLFTVEGDLINRCEIFDEADVDAALARFDELDRQTPLLENAATRAWARLADAFNRRDLDGLIALGSDDGRYEDRRQGLRDTLDGPARRKAAQATFETAPSSWQVEVEPIAIRGSRFSLTRQRYRDADFADRPIVAEILHVTEIGDDDLLRDIVSFDPDDINEAFAELTARWIASGDVAYPEPIEAVDRINATINRHDWDAVATCFAGAEYVNHRQLAQSVNGTIADWLFSMQTAASLVPDLWVELAEVSARSAIGIVGRTALKGTSTDGAAVEITFFVLILLRGEHVTRLEAFDENQRDLALARFEELSVED